LAEASAIGSVLEVIDRVLEEGGLGLDDVLGYSTGIYEALSATLASYDTLRHETILAAYMAELSRVVGILSRSLSVRGFSAAEAGLVVGLLTGKFLVLESEGHPCMAVRLKASIVFDGGFSVGKGSVTCLKPRRAIHLVLSGLAEPVATGLEELFRRLGSRGGESL